MTVAETLIIFPLLIAVFVATLLHITKSKKDLDSLIETICSSLFVAVCFYVLSVHISVLLGLKENYIKYFLAGTVLVSVLMFGIGAGVPLVRLFAISLLLALALAVRLSDPDSPIFNFVSNWFQRYFPYEGVDPNRVALGVCVFTFMSLAILFFIRSENEKRKSVVLRRGAVGLDIAALEKVTIALSGLIALLVAMIVTGVNLPTVTVVGGLLAAGVGFAAKDLLVNIAAGIVLVWDKSFKIDDVISVEGGGYGWIDRLSLRHAVVKDRDEVNILIPYTKLLSGTIHNWTYDDGIVRLKVNIGVDYEERNYEKIKEILARATRAASDRILEKPVPKVNIMAAGSSAVEFQIRFYINDPKNGIRNVMSDVIGSVLEAMHREGIKIPYQTLDINIQNFRSKRDKQASD